MPTDTELGASFRCWADYLSRGTRADREELYEEIEAAKRSHFPWQPAVIALSNVDTRALWKTFDDPELQDLYDWAHEAGLRSAAVRFRLPRWPAHPSMTARFRLRLEHSLWSAMANDVKGAGRPTTSPSTIRSFPTRTAEVRRTQPTCKFCAGPATHARGHVRGCLRPRSVELRRWRA
jgi:hypothetical protein